MSPNVKPPSSFLRTTDASGKGWGAQLNDMRLAGQWSPQELGEHSNGLELMAVRKVLNSQAPAMSQSSLMIMSDNRTVVSYLRNEGGTKSQRMMDTTYDILSILDLFRIHMTVQFIPGRYNVEADRLSRFRSQSEWHLLPSATGTIFQLWGTPEIDLFASQKAHVVPAYVTLDPIDPNAVFVNAFSQKWVYQLAWIFPPPCLIPRVLIHLNKATGTFLMVVPNWEKVFWRSDLRNRALAPPVEIGNLQTRLVDVQTQRPPSDVKRMVLEVWLIRGGPP
ncbi:uncharacterized protein [Choristoneura fumiferana]|uniref:uncharacterized protein n=1 Tax=Choristoneura fumiferana TaxID=7141 RepID=UPI003D15B93F